ncbi:MAG: hypothetical protein ABEJ23_03625 [Haloarculaceae archaeon]
MTDRPYVPWLTRNDEVILEYMADGATLSPIGAPSADLDVEGDATFVLLRRLPRLFAAGLVKETGAAEYALAGKGQAYLAGDLDPAALETPDERE